MKHTNWKLPLGIFLVFLLLSLLAPLLAPYDPNAVDMSIRLQGPSLTHWLGTDALGRDLLSRVIYGGRGTLFLSLSATLLSMCLGIILGMLAGWFGGMADSTLTVLANLFQGLPGSCLLVAMAGIFGPGIPQLIVALVLTSWAGIFRILRTHTIQLREESFIEGLRALGAGHLRLISAHLFPNLLPQLAVLFPMRLGSAIRSLAALSYLGLGLPPPAPDWSVMIRDAQLYARTHPHLILVPGLCLLALLFALYRLGDGLRDTLDRRSQEVPL